jgi:hypothetical protein
MSITDELLYGTPAPKPKEQSMSVTDELLYGNRATGGFQPGSGVYPPIEKPPVAISEPSYGC